MLRLNQWVKAARSGNNDNGPNCLECRQVDGGRVVVRDSKLGDASPVLEYTRQQWETFVEQTASGVQDRAGDAFLVHDPRADVNDRLIFTPGEWEAFVSGCRGGEFAFAAV